jgi:hypothetical protein
MVGRAIVSFAELFLHSIRSVCLLVWEKKLEQNTFE